jgi:hypothetical protein
VKRGVSSAKFSGSSTHDSKDYIMSLFDNNSTSAGNTSTGGKSDKPSATVFINVGKTVKYENPESGETEEMFLSLPMGIGLDNMEELVAKGTSETWANTVQGKNAIRAFCLSLAADLEPGEGLIADMLQVEIRRVKDKMAPPAPGTNPLLEQLAAFGIK